MECNCTVVEDIDEKYRKWQPCNRSLQKHKPYKAVSVKSTKFMTKSNIQLENIDEVGDEEKLCDYEMLMNLGNE